MEKNAQMNIKKKREKHIKTDVFFITRNCEYG